MIASVGAAAGRLWEYAAVQIMVTADLANVALSSYGGPRIGRGASVAAVFRY